MISREQAQAIAATHISAISGNDHSCVIMEAQAIERSYGWVFFYQSRRYLETQDSIHALAGNAPLIVDCHTGQVIETGTAHPLEYYLAQYEATRGAGAA